jgi:hypothetical protein
VADPARIQVEQRVADDVLSLAAALGFACPPIAIGAAALKALVDVGFAAFLGKARAAADEMRREQAAGQAAAVASAVTEALARERRAPMTCGAAIPGRDARVFHGADCATSIGCGREIGG